MNDEGTIFVGDAVAQVLDVQSYGGYVLHVASLARGALAVGDEVTCGVDRTRRRRVVPNHTSTHLLQWALRQVLVVT